MTSEVLLPHGSVPHAGAVLNPLATVLRRATAQSATVVTEPTPFYGETTLGRMRDPWQNIWWLWALAPGQPDPTPDWGGGTDAVFTTLDKTLRALTA